MTALDKTAQIVKIMDAKKAADIRVLQVNDLTILADYFIIASTDNATHVKAISDEVEFQLKQQGISPKNMEGYRHANWIVLDYSDVVVHLFHEETRAFYALERLWSDGQQIDVQALLHD